MADALDFSRSLEMTRKRWNDSESVEWHVNCGVFED